MKIEKKYLEIPFDCITGLIIEPGIKFTKDGMFIKSFTFDIPKYFFQ